MSIVEFRHFYAGVVILAAAGSSFAVSLGRVQGAAILGRPLSLSFEARYDAGEDVSPSCFEAVVMHGDTRVDPSRIKITTITGNGQVAQIRLQSTVPVEDLSVAVTLKVTCDLNVSRQYTLLTELGSDSGGNVVVSEPAPVVAPRPAVVGSIQKKDVVAAPTEARSSSGENRATPRVRRAPSAVVRPRETVAAKPKRDVAPVTVSKESVAGAESSRGPRLKLDASELALQRKAPAAAVPAQPPASESPAVPPSDLQTLQASLASLQEKMAAESEQRLKLESELKAIKSNGAQSGATINELKLKLQQAQEDQYNNPVVYGLLALLVAALGGLAYLWRRMKSAAGAQAWWSGADKGRWDPSSLQDFPSSSAQVDSMSLAPADAINSMSGVDVNLDFSESTFRREEAKASPTGPAPLAPEPAESVPVQPPPRELKPIQMAAPAVPSPADDEQLPTVTDDLVDVQQHAEFFVSLGQYDQAVETLRKYIDQHPEASPLAYLDLLKVHHMLTQTAEYSAVREAFNRIFSGQVPEFGDFLKSGQTLDAYPRTLARIQLAWGGADAVSTVEECLLRPHADAVGESFDLDAYKELLVLHAVARQVQAGSAGAASSKIKVGDLSSVFVVGSAATALVSASGSPLGVLAAEIEEPLPLISADMPLDLDLTQPHFPEQTTADQLPVVDLGEAGEESGPVTEMDLNDLLPEAAPAASVAADPHLIDFDVFDIEAPKKPQA